MAKVFILWSWIGIPKNEGQRMDSPCITLKVKCPSWDTTVN